MAIRAKSRRVEDAFELFQLEKRGDRVSQKTLEFYEQQVGKLLHWLGKECPQALRFDGLDGTVLRRFRADLAGSLTKHGRPLQPESLRASHRGVMAFLRWAADAGFAVDDEVLRLKPPRREHKEATVYHVAQVRQILARCENRTEELAVKILVGSGVRISEVCGLALRGPDGVSDLMLDSMDRGRAELRVRSDGGAKGAKTRRVPITPKLAAAMKRYASLDRPESDSQVWLLNRRGQPFQKGGIDAMMDRFKERVGFRVHAHAFRHTFATVATQGGWNLERLRVAMGHWEATNLAATQTRAAKLAHLATADLRTGWREEASAAGLDPARLAEVLGRASVAPPDEGVHQRVTAELTENASTFGRRELVQTVAADARCGLPVPEVLARSEALLKSSDVIPVVGTTRDQDVIRRADGTVSRVPTDEPRTAGRRRRCWRSSSASSRRRSTAGRPAWRWSPPPC